MVFRVMLAVLAMAALQDVHASRLKISTLVENSNVDGDGPTDLDQQHVTQSESKAVPGTIHSESSQVKEKESFAHSHDSAGSIDAFSSSLVEMTPRYGLNKSPVDKAELERARIHENAKAEADRIRKESEVLIKQAKEKAEAEKQEIIERARKEAKLEAAHPACNGQPTCRCAEFYDLLIKQCMEQVEEASAMEKEECFSKILFLWTNQVPTGSSIIEKEWLRWSYDFFLKPFREFHSDEEDAPKALEGVFAGFWAGYSWTLGTRQVLDKLIGSQLLTGAFGTDTNQTRAVFHLEDIEHRTHRIGAVMRHLRWDRGCHQSGHDANLWLSLSKAYAEGTSAAAQKFSVQKTTTWSNGVKTLFGGQASVYEAPPVVVFINKLVKDLRKTFLFLHEFPLMEDFSKIVLVDYKNECEPELIRMAEKASNNRFNDKLVCLKGGDEHDMGKLFADEKHAVQLAEDLDLLKEDRVPGIKWHVVGEAPMYSEKSAKGASFEECQTQCNQWKPCKFFTYHPKRSAKGQCVMFHRDVSLDYKHTERTVISGRKQKQYPKKEQTDSEAPYSFYGQGVAGPTEIWAVDAAKGLGEQSCFLAVMQDGRCHKDFFTYVSRGDKNCGCKGDSGALSIASSTICDIYRITQATCASFACPPYWRTKNLESRSLSEEECCEETCASFGCPAYWRRKNLESTSLSEEECCEETCATFNCPDDSSSPFTMKKKNEDSTELSEDNCCQSKEEVKMKTELVSRATEESTIYHIKLRSLVDSMPSDKLDLYLSTMQEQEEPPSIFVDSFGVAVDETIPKDEKMVKCISQIEIFNQQLWDKAKPHFKMDFVFTNMTALGQNHAQAKMLKLISSFQFVGGLLVTAKDDGRTKDPALMLWSCFRTPNCGNPILAWTTELGGFSRAKKAVTMPDTTLVGEVLHNEDVNEFRACGENRQVSEFWTRTSIGVVKHQRLIGTSHVYLTSACPPWRVKRTAMYRHEVVALAREFGQLSHGTGDPWKPDVSIYVQKSCNYASRCADSSTSICADDADDENFESFCKDCEAESANPSPMCCCRCCQDCQKLTKKLGGRMQGVLLQDTVLDVKCYVCDNLRMCAEQDIEPLLFQIERDQEIKAIPTEKMKARENAEGVEEGAGKRDWYNPQNDVTIRLNDELNDDFRSLDKEAGTRIDCKIGSDWKLGYIVSENGGGISARLDVDGDDSHPGVVKCEEWELAESLTETLRRDQNENGVKNLEKQETRLKAGMEECEAEKGTYIFEKTQWFCRHACLWQDADDGANLGSSVLNFMRRHFHW